MGSKEGKDRRKRRDIVRGRFRFLWGEVDISTEDGDKDVLIPAARLNRQLPVRSDAADSSRETVRMKGGPSREVGSKDSQKEGVEERREASAREG